MKPIFLEGESLTLNQMINKMSGEYNKIKDTQENLWIFYFYLCRHGIATRKNTYMW